MKIKKQLNNTSIKLPAIGQGIGDYSWGDDQVDIIREGIDLGMNLVDTAENYDSGNSEKIIGKAVKGIREEVIICTKFAPEHSSSEDILKAVEGSLKRLQTDYIDIYQLHWHNPKIPLRETIQAMERLVKEGKIRYIGVSNLYLRQLKEAQEALSYSNIVSLQMEYNLFDHFVKHEILPYCEKEKIITIAYSPLDQGRIASDEDNRLNILQEIAKKYSKSVAQIALNWLIMHPTVVAIPTASKKYMRENAEVSDFEISKEDFNKISVLYARKPAYVEVNKIKVSTSGQNNRKVYQTLKEALENKLNFIPSPEDLARYFRDYPEEEIKPIRLIRNKNDKYQYSLIEGRVRYWAWVIAHEGEKPIPAYIRTIL